MNTDENNLEDFLTLGQHLYILRTSNNVELLLEEIPSFLQKLKDCCLKRSISAAQSIREIDQLRHKGGRILRLDAERLRACVDTLLVVIYEEARERKLIEIKAGYVLEELRQLPTQIQLTQAQDRLFDETIFCIERGAWRAAIVMGWNFAYDYIRQWVFDNRLADFNNSLTTKYKIKAGDSRYKAIVNYEDFFNGNPDERTVINTCFLANIIGGKVRDELWQHLRRRNSVAHANSRFPIQEQACSFIRDLIELISESPFSNKT
ncbi:hypothetical protein [Gimesia sp.]|uniref:hypothetical protein n=1 Tax=Gimesia sp. TaxID=2024833 RepID=UPI000C64BC8D|nr:hypothetical protein [Gimesia sp.]MAX38664.1 hypothetical protein [Gimesia sp.]HAH48399.1 hypothetical protein [Planctomycetaceae bacterium]HBL43721.1 hypothetical protein [Planctomycetaceae bacterium]|tara:strand:+ start:3149 stop:3937 length:789 start_codon:yes stop_codon:yes gene_type:complete